MARTRRGGWKIRTIGTTLAAALMLGGALAGTAGAAPGDATHVYIDAGNSSAQPVGGPAGRLHQAWSFTADNQLSGALIAGGRVFARDGESVFALDAATGRRLWARRLGRIGGFVYAGGHVVVDSSFAGAVVALDPATGATAWLSTLPREQDVVTDADDGHVVLTNDDPSGGGIDVLDAATGARTWSANTRFAAPPVIAGGELFVAPPGISHGGDFNYDEEIDAYNLATGTRRVVARGVTSGAGALSLHGGLLYANQQLPRNDYPYTRGAALDPVTGAQSGGPYDATGYLTSDAGGIYLRRDVRDVDMNITSTISAFATPGAAARWTYTPYRLASEPPLAAGGRIWAAGYDAQDHATVTGLDPATGAVAQTLDLGAVDDPVGYDTGVRAPLSAGGGLLLVPSGSRLVAFAGDDPVAGSPTGPVAPLAAPDVGADTGVTGARQDAGRSGLAPGAPAPPLGLRWQVAAGRLDGTPLIIGDTAIAARRARNADGDDAGQAMLTAYALSDGTVRWEVPLVDADARYDGWQLSADGGRVYAADGETALTAFDAADGHRLWTHEWDPGLNRWPAPVARDGRVYAVEGSTATAYDGATGDVAWTRSLVLGIYSSSYAPPPAADDQHFYVLASSPVDGKECALTALDSRTGAVDWSVPRTCVEWDGIAAAGGRVAFDGAIFDADTGRIVDTARGTKDGALARDGVMVSQSYREGVGLLSARRPGAADVWSVHDDDVSPLLTGPLVWTTIDEQLTALKIGDGAAAWRSAIALAETTRLAGAAAGVLLTASPDGELSAWSHDGATGPEVAVAQPVSPTRSATSVVRFSVPADAGAATACAVDGGAFAACTSPWTTPALSAGTHRLRVRAGGSGPVASVVVVVDRTAPVTTVLTAVPAYVDRLTLRFTANEAARFTCSWDGAAERACYSGEIDLGTEVDGEGPHSLTIRATDMAGNAETPGTTLRWTADHRSPTVTASLSVRKTRADTVRPAVTQSEPGRLECALDDGAWATCPDPVAATARTDGFHTLAVRLVDRAGTAGRPATVTWERDTTGPAPDIDPLWNQIQHDTLSVYVRAGDLHDFARAECRIDAEAWVRCGDDLRWDHGGLTEGHHVFQYRGWDDIGNQGPTIVRGFDAFPGALIAAPPMEVAWRVGWQGSLSKGDSWGGTYPDDCTIDGVTRPCPGGSLIYLGDLAPGWHWAVQTTRDTSGRAVCSRTAWWPIALPDGSVPGTAPRRVAGGGWSTGPGDPGPNDEPGGSGAPPCGSYASAPGAEPWPTRAPEDPPADPPSDPPSDPGSGGTTDPPPSDSTSTPGTTVPPAGDPPAGDPATSAPESTEPPASDPAAGDAPVVALAAPPAPPLALIGASSPATTTPTTTPAPPAFGPATLRRHGVTALALTVRAPARGVLTVRVTHDGTTIATARQSVRRAGSVRVTVRPTAAGRRLLRRHRGALRVRLALRLGTAGADRAVRVG